MIGGGDAASSNTGPAPKPKPVNKTTPPLTTYGSMFKSGANASSKPVVAPRTMTNNNRSASSTSSVTARKNTLMREGIAPADRKQIPKAKTTGAPKAAPVRLGNKTSGALGEVQWTVEYDKARRKKPEEIKRHSAGGSIGDEYHQQQQESAGVGAPATSNDRSSLGSSSSSTRPHSIHGGDYGNGSDEYAWDSKDDAWRDRFTERAGRGKSMGICDSSGRKVLCIESSSSSFPYLMTYSSNGSNSSGNNSSSQHNETVNYDNLELCASVSVNNSGLGQCSLVMDYRHSKDRKDDFLAITLNTQQKMWRLERSESGKMRTIQNFVDESLRSSRYLDIRVRVKDSNTISLQSNNREIIERWELGEVMHDGAVGFSVFQSKCLVRHWRVGSCASEGGVSKDERVIDLRNLPPNIDRALADSIMRDIVLTDLRVNWEDIAGLSTAKKLLKEAAVLPLILPEFFQGLRQPWKGVLLFGPPGTAKTMLAKAVSSQAKTTFFNCSASTLVSKWHGESERLVKCLFQLARHFAPSTIFFDEIDALMMTRGGTTEHEASRRLKSELLSQIDGISSGETNGLVMVLATTNKPWDLDEAMRRRLEKRIYIPLPDELTRQDMFQLFLKTVEVDSSVQFDKLADMSKGYSGADIYLICRDASMRPLRREIADKDPDEIMEMKQNGGINLIVTMKDFEETFQSINPSVGTKELDKYDQWMQEFGSI